MDLSFLNILLNVFSIIVLVGGIFAYSRSKLPSETIKLYQDNQAAQTARLDSLGEELRTARAEMITMREEIRVIKTLPLESITTTLGAMLETQNAILKTQNLILEHVKLPQPSSVTVNTPGPVTTTTN